MAPLSEDSIHGIASMQKGKHRFPPLPKLLESALDPVIAARRGESPLEHRNRFPRPAGRLIDLRQIQIQLGVIAPQIERFQTKPLRIGEPLLGKRCHQTSVRQVERVLWGTSQRTLDVHKSLVGVTIAKVLQTFLEIRHAAIGRRQRFDAIGHSFPSVWTIARLGQQTLTVGDCGDNRSKVLNARESQ